MRLSVSLAVLATMVAAGIAPALAESWPTQTVKIITPFPPGSGGDITARPFAERLSKRWGKPVIVENRPGADGIIAVSAVLNSTDGHTLLYTNGGPLTSNLLSHAGSLPYDPNDLLPISGAADVYVAIAVPASLSIDSLSDFVARARSRQGQFNWSGTPGSLDYLVPGFLSHAGLYLQRVTSSTTPEQQPDVRQRPRGEPRAGQARWHHRGDAVDRRQRDPREVAGKMRAAVVHADRAEGAPRLTQRQAGLPIDRLMRRERSRHGAQRVERGDEQPGDAGCRASRRRHDAGPA